VGLGRAAVGSAAKDLRAAEQKAWKASGPDRGVAGIRDESGDVIGVLVDSGEFAFEAKGTWSADGVNFRLTVDLAAGRSE
jgi:hypothetical protein